MNQVIKLNSCILALLLCTMSCSKEPKQSSDQQSAASIKTAAQTSSVLGYWKNSTKLVSTVDATPGYTYAVVYSIGPISVAQFDVISAHFQQQVDYAGADNVMVGAAVVVGTNSSVVHQLSPGFVGFISNLSGTNLTVEEADNEVVSRTGSFRFPNAASNIYINAVLYGANLSGNPPGALDLTLPSGSSGELIAVLENGVTRVETHTQAFTNMAVSGTKFVNKTLGPYGFPANTMVDIRYEAEATTAVPMPAGNFNQRFGRWVSEGASVSDQGGFRLIEPIQLGATHAEHHMTVSHAGGKFYPSGESSMFYNVITYGHGWGSATTPTYPLKIEQSTANNYGHYVVEMRSSGPNNFYEKKGTAVTSLSSTPQVLYSVGPLTINPNQVVEVRYQAGFDPGSGVTVASKIVRAASATATTGVDVQPALERGFHPYYEYTNIIQSTAERNGPGTLTGQYYNVVAWRTGGASSCPVLNWGELEAVKR